MRSAGYAPFNDPNTGKLSYVRKMTAGYYPRFHVYVEEKDKIVTFDLHLDQKKPSYTGTAMHGGEYDGPTVEAEIARMRESFAGAIR